MITLRNLKKRYGHMLAVDDLSLEVRKGEILGFLGPNGAGKTTTIKMICGLLKPSSGTVDFQLEGAVKGRPRQYLGYCPQENIFWPKLTIREQLQMIGRLYGMPGPRIHERSESLMDQLGLRHQSGTLAKNLSGGMKRRLNIGLALIHDPQILIFDEPEAGLDPQSRVQVREFIKSLSEHKTVIITTHNMDEADRLSDRVAIIDRGRLIKLDTPKNLKQSIGEGDIVIIGLSGLTDTLNRLEKVLGREFDSVTLQEQQMLIKSEHLLSRIPEITSIFKDYGIPIQEITLRENTLEDVFIHLTGKALRP
jgi:ABC-2 type transport system ATP-binding protein